MEMTTKTLLLLTLAFISCNRISPAGFWSNYRADLLAKNIGDQGPYGGHKALYWKSDKPYTFSAATILDFASKNGWALTDSVEFNQDQTSQWTHNNRAVFPLTSAGFTIPVLNDTQLERFPRWFDGPLQVYKFRTSWVLIEPGTDNSTEGNGFVIMNRNRTQMAVYHSWGE
ncbi:hypothetical protein DNI29_16545 [Hymenobacter sediminis]|uniref:hypothetical protein n=1 Tax=Hymenobacter sediminis TaxID=2218621 RepID=UPI000DA6789B|nr:hypothetical protein [Hymenobacter sediminis]RPD45763.1 hypothetical protein DNI29_16545 [Hymenobacter sediminis]